MSSVGISIAFAVPTAGGAAGGARRVIAGLDRMTPGSTGIDIATVSHPGPRSGGIGVAVRAGLCGVHIGIGVRTGFRRQPLFGAGIGAIARCIAAFGLPIGNLGTLGI